MAREHHLVVRDFLGLGDCTRGATEREDPLEMVKDGQGKPFLSTVVPSKTPPSHFFHDVDSSRTNIAIGQSVQNTMVLLSENDLPRLLPPHDDNRRKNSGPAAALLTPNTLHRSMTLKDTKYSAWNKNVNMQQVLPVPNSQVNDRCVERTGQQFSDGLLPYPLYPYQMQDFINSNQGNALCSQIFALGHNAMGDQGDCGKRKTRSYATYGNVDTDSHLVVQARQYQNPPMALSTTAVDERGSASYFSSDFVGTLPKSMPALSASNFKDQIFAVPVLGNQPVTVASATSSLSRMLSSDVTGKQSSAQLTLFYAGNVNVYDDVSVDKAREIMLLAGSASSGPLQGYNSVAGQCAPFRLLNAGISHGRTGSLPHGHNVSFNTQERVQPNTETCQASTQPAAGPVSQSHLLVNNQLECSKPVTTPASSSLAGGQTVVPRPLPQARKASLARFLEKRRERVQTKSPYPMKNPCGEQSLLPGERFSSSNYDSASPTPQDKCVDKKQMSTSCDMEEMTGTYKYTSACDIVAKEDNRLSAAGRRVVDAEMAVKVLANL